MPNLTALIQGRCIQGLQVGILSVTVPIYQCEVSPRHGRGLFASIEYLCLNASYALSTWVGYTFFYIPHEISWRGLYIIQACLAITLVIWKFFLPETPRWLIKKGFQRQGMRTLADLHARSDIYDPLVTNSYPSRHHTRVLHRRSDMEPAFHTVHPPRYRRYHLSVIRPVQRDQHQENNMLLGLLELLESAGLTGLTGASLKFS